MGTHDELLSMEGFYYKLYQLQFEKKSKVAWWRVRKVGCLSVLPVWFLVNDLRTHIALRPTTNPAATKNNQQFIIDLLSIAYWKFLLNHLNLKNSYLFDLLVLFFPLSSGI
jgi:hypothetical protein